jgi:GH18 family chitinase
VEENIVAYKEIKQYETDGILSATTEDLTKLLAAYATYKTSDGQTVWVGYDTLTTLQAKVCFARSRKLRGLMFWDADSDDNLEMIKAVKAFMDSPNCAGISGFKIPTKCT